MKRTEREEGDAEPQGAAAAGVDELHAKISKYMTEHRHLLNTYANLPCPSAPLNGIEKAFTEMERSVVACFAGDADPVSLNFFNYDDDLVKNALSCGWWQKHVLVWDAEVVDRRAAYLKLHGTTEQAEKFHADVHDRCFQEIRKAIAEGWNKLHPKLPGHWDDDDTDFVITYVD
jgi:hypothetical protein